MNTYFLVRHGETIFNKRCRFMGVLDIPLSEEGLSQAKTLEENIRNLHFDLAFSSHLSRAYHTATIVLGMAIPVFHKDGSYTLVFHRNRDTPRDIPIITDQRLSERSFGDLTGVSKATYQDEFPKYRGRNVAKSFEDQPDRGENFAHLEVRLRDLLLEINQMHSGKNIIIFSHNGPIRVLRKIIEGLTEEDTLCLNNPHCELIKCTY